MLKIVVLIGEGMIRFYIVNILLIILALTFVSCGEKERGVPPPELKDRIVYVSEDGICTINPDGTDRKLIVPSEQGGPFSNPKWSPEKRWIAFTGHVGRYQKVMLAKSDGSKLDTLGVLEKSKDEGKKKKRNRLKVEQKEYSISFVGWSPDEKYILCYPGVGLDFSAFRLTDKKGKTIGQVGGGSPSFLGKNEIVYIGYHGAVHTVGTDIYSIPLNGGEKKNLTEDSKLGYFSPVGSPDGEKIAYVFGKSAIDNELWIMNSDGSNRRRLASQDKDFIGGPLPVIKFSPGGDRILFLPKNGNKSRIYVITVDGTGLRAITDQIINADGGADWSPDGRHITFTSDKDGNDELYVVNIDGTGLKRLTNNNIKDCCPDW